MSISKKLKNFVADNNLPMSALEQLYDIGNATGKLHRGTFTLGETISLCALCGCTLKIENNRTGEELSFNLQDLRDEERELAAALTDQIQSGAYREEESK